MYGSGYQVDWLATSRWHVYRHTVVDDHQPLPYFTLKQSGLIGPLAGEPWMPKPVK